MPIDDEINNRSQRIWIPISALNSAEIPKETSGNASSSRLINSISAILVSGMLALQRNVGYSIGNAVNQSSITHAQAFRIPSAMYDSLSNTIASFGAVPEGESIHLDAESIVSGQKFIELMRMCNVDIPHVFAHGGDALVFTWDMLHARRYITTSDNSAALQEIDAETAKVSLERFFDLENQAERDELLGIIGGRTWKQITSRK